MRGASRTMPDFAFRFAVWAAASKPEQVKDKDTINKQIEESIAAGVRLGGKHVATYIAPGYKRTGYYDLSAAAKKIPDLQRCLDELRQWDVLICKNYDRYRSIGDMMFAKLSLENRRQLHSVQQSTTLYPPDEYEPYKDNATPMMLKLSGINDVYAIAKIVDNFDVGIPDRAEKGQYPIRPPRGYVNNSVYQNRKLVQYKLDLDPLVSKVLIAVRKMYMRGASTIQCSDYAKDHGVHMTPTGVLYMLEHPFYAGKVVLDATMKEKDGDGRVANPHVKLFDGQHPALWTYEEHLATVAEIQRRSRVIRRKRTFPLTGLLTCSVCGAKLITQQSNMSGKFLYYRCRQAKHAAIRHDMANQKVAQEIQKLFRNYRELPDAKAPSAVDNQKAIRELERKREKIRMTYESPENEHGELYSLGDFSKAIKTINAQITELADEQRQQALVTEAQSQGRQMRRTIKENLQYFEKFMTHEPAGEINVLLSNVCEKITVYPDRHIEIKLKS